jgi:hypothetical protein
MTSDGRRLLEHFSFKKCEQLGGFYRVEDGQWWFGCLAVNS